MRIPSPLRFVRRLSITARITIGSLIVAIVFVSIGAFAVRLSVESIVHNATVSLLKHDAAAYLPPAGQQPGKVLPRHTELKHVAIVDPHDHVLYSTLPHSLEAKVTTLAHQGDDPRTITGGRDRYLVYTLELATTAGHWHIVAARDLDASVLVLAGVNRALVVGSIVLVFGFAGASWLLTFLALRPVMKMRRKAESISGEEEADLLPVGPAQDELSALATTLNDLIGRLRASAERERQMVSNASHELRTPIAVLQSQLELASANTGDEAAMLADVRASRATVTRLSQLATNLLELSRLEADPTRGSAGWDELATEVADSIDRARLLSASTNITIDFDTRVATDATDTPAATVALTTHAFGRILDNLLSNAAAAVAGDGWVSARLELTADRVRLDILDSGPGMPVEFIPVALDRFTRSERSRSSHTGSGLGLALVDALVRSADGRVHLENTEDAGLHVRVELPLSSVNAR